MHIKIAFTTRPISCDYFDATMPPRRFKPVIVTPDNPLPTYVSSHSSSSSFQNLSGEHSDRNNDHVNSTVCDPEEETEKESSEQVAEEVNTETSVHHCPNCGYDLMKAQDDKMEISKVASEIVVEGMNSMSANPDVIRKESNVKVEDTGMIIEITSPRNTKSGENANVWEDAGKFGAIFRVFGRSGGSVKKREKKKEKLTQEHEKKKRTKRKEKKKSDSKEGDVKIKKEEGSMGIRARSKKRSVEKGKTGDAESKEVQADKLIESEESSEIAIEACLDSSDKSDIDGLAEGGEKVISLAHDDFIEYSVRKNKNRKKESLGFLSRRKKGDGDGDKVTKIPQVKLSSSSSAKVVTAITKEDQTSGNSETEDSDDDIGDQDDLAEVISLAHDDFVEYSKGASNKKKVTPGMNNTRALYRLIRVEPAEDKNVESMVQVSMAQDDFIEYRLRAGSAKKKKKAHHRLKKIDRLGERELEEKDQ